MIAVARILLAVTSARCVIQGTLNSVMTVSNDTVFSINLCLHPENCGFIPNEKQQRMTALHSNS